MLLLTLLFTGMFFGELEACIHGSDSVQPCFDRTRIVFYTQVLLIDTVENMGTLPLNYRGNLTVTTCHEEASADHFLCTAEMMNMTVWNVSQFHLISVLTRFMPSF